MSDNTRKDDSKTNSRKDEVEDTSGPQSHEDAKIGAEQNRDTELENRAKRDAEARAKLNPPVTSQGPDIQNQGSARTDKKPIPPTPNTVRTDDVSKVTGSEATIRDMKIGATGENIPKKSMPEALNIHPDTSQEHPAPSTDTYGAASAKQVEASKGQDKDFGLRSRTENLQEMLARLKAQNEGKSTESISKISLDEDELKHLQGLDDSANLERNRKINLIAHVLKESGADSMSQIKALERIKEII